MTALCISLTEPTSVDIVDRMMDLAPFADAFEIRADVVDDVDLLTILRARTRPLIFTARSLSEGGHLRDDDPRRHALLHQAIRRGFDFVDIEYRSGFFDLMTEKVGRGLVVSYHDVSGTPQDLDLLYDGMCKAGADVVKIAVTPRSLTDVGRVMAFMKRQQSGPRPLVAIAMGPLGAITRIVGPKYGARFTFAAPGTGTGIEAAPGQIEARELIETYRIREIGPNTRVYGLLGSDVMRSLSPAMHNRAFRERGLDCVYVPLQSDSAASFFTALKDLGLSGFSVTRPFKVEVASRCDEVDAAALQSHSVNTVAVGPDGRLTGTSTDGIGVVALLLKRGPINGRSVMILGAGGAARAAATGLRECGARVRIVARDVLRASQAAAETGSESGTLGDIAKASWDVLINATPVGGGDLEEQSLVPGSALRRGAIVFDMVYDPLETRLLREAAAAGCVTISGFEMLLTQAGAQFEVWTGQEAPQGAMSGAALLAIQARAV